MTAPISLIPYAFSANTYAHGAERGPLFLAEKGLAESLSGNGRDVVWHRDPRRLIPAFFDGDSVKGKDAEDHLFLACRTLCEDVETVVKNGRIPVTLGGDHTMAMGSVAGFARAKKTQGKTGLLWIDAHPDVQTRKTTYGGSWHGMGLATLLGRNPCRMTELAQADAVIDPQHVFCLGLRSIDEPEIHFIARNNLRVATNGDIGQLGMKHVLEDAARVLGKGTDALFLTIDLDVCDPSTAPAVGTPVPGGFMRDDLLEALSWITKELDFGGFEIAELNPEIEGAETTASLIRDILNTVRLV